MLELMRKFKKMFFRVYQEDSVLIEKYGRESISLLRDLF